MCYYGCIDPTQAWKGRTIPQTIHVWHICTDELGWFFRGNQWGGKYASPMDGLVLEFGDSISNIMFIFISLINIHLTHDGTRLTH